MNHPLIIGLTGSIASGKDTVAEMLMRNYKYTQASFAEPVKDVLAPLFSWDRQMLEGKTPESRIWRETPDTYWSTILGYEFSPRIAMQRIGTNLFRDCFHTDIWIRSIQKRVQDKYPNQSIIFSDCRFENEINMVRAMGGIIIEVQAEVLPVWYDAAVHANTSGSTEAQQQFIEKYKHIHASEYSWIGVNMPDITIVNDSTLTELETKVQQLFQ